MGNSKKILKFTGCGNAFNVEQGNNNAYIKKEKSLLLIDCGSLTFSEIINNNLMDDVDNIFLLITHTHSDHIGSLGDLIAYCYYIKNKIISIIYPINKYIKQYLELIGVGEELYNLINEQQKYHIRTKDFNIIIEPIRTKHVNNLISFGYILNYDTDVVYFSGDSFEISQYVLNKFYNNEINYIYQDTCEYDFKGNPHLCIEKLCKYIHKEYRDKIYCMHFDEQFDFNKALKYGFNVVDREV